PLAAPPSLLLAFDSSSRSIASPSTLYALKNSPVPSGHDAHSQSSHVKTCLKASTSTSRSRRRRSISLPTGRCLSAASTKHPAAHKGSAPRQHSPTSATSLIRSDSRDGHPL